MRDHIKRVIKESALWMAANGATTGIALLATYLLVSLTTKGPVVLTSLLGIAGLVSVTWGSWISLSWTRSLGLRAGMKGITLVPGLLLLTSAGVGFYVGIGSTLAWLALILSAIGTLTVTVLLWRYMPRASAQTSRENLAMGFLFYPIATSLTASAVGWMWLYFLTNPFHSDWRSLISMATVMVTVLAVELVTTALPAGFSMVCSQASTLLKDD
jgi:hypothetical protein